MSRPRILGAALLAAMPVAQAWAQAATPAAPAADPAAEAFRAWDKDKNGNLSVVEFRAGWVQVQRVAETQARLRQQFAAVDTNKNGAIDPPEYRSLLLVKQAGKNAPQMSVFDRNRDGKLGFGEYVKLVQALAPQEVRDGTK
jgi:Ca2+-binding EF-hand superfamily protein